MRIISRKFDDASQVIAALAEREGKTEALADDVASALEADVDEVLDEIVYAIDGHTIDTDAGTLAEAELLDTDLDEPVEPGERAQLRLDVGKRITWRIYIPQHPGGHNMIPVERCGFMQGARATS